MPRQEEYDINELLLQCKQSASYGYELASDYAARLNRTLMDAENSIADAVNTFSESSVYDSAATGLLEQQLMDIRASFNQLSLAYNYDLSMLKKNAAYFTITLFGRTEAGKSTLMEVLKHGDGKSIGKGAQRTTRNVRKYKWNNLLIKDVPGIAAFGGQEDESIAFEAAKSADLVLFLITDDGPQAAEIECFSRIINLGKPVICIMNVKHSIDEDDIEMSIDDIKDCFDFDRLNEIKQEFFSYGDELGSGWRWKKIPFVYVHLEAAFFSQKIKDKDLAYQFRRISRIDYLKRVIIEQIRSKGRFYRFKTFLDLIAGPTLESEEALLSQCLSTREQYSTMHAKKRRLEEWKRKFCRDGSNQIESLVTDVRSMLYSQIASFAEDHFADKNADKAWNSFLKHLGLAKKCQSLLENLESQTNDHIKELSREMINELQFTSFFSEDKRLRMRRIVDKRKVWNWSTLVLGSSLSIGSGISYLIGASLTGPLGWGAIAVATIGSAGALLFKSRDKKEYEARRRLEKNLKKNADLICNNIRTQMLGNFDKLINERVVKLISEIERMESVIDSLSDTQRKLAWELNRHLLEMNGHFISEALKLIDEEDNSNIITEVARVPGNTILLQLKNGVRFPDDVKMKLQDLISEKILFVYKSGYKTIFVSRILGKSIDRNRILLDGYDVVRIPADEVDPNIINRARLAQQMTKLIITQ